MAIALFEKPEIIAAALIVLVLVNAGILLNLNRISRRHASYIPVWQCVFSAMVAIFCLGTAISYGLAWYTNFHWVFMADSLNWQGRSWASPAMSMTLFVSFVNGLIYGFRIRLLMKTTHQIKEQLIQRQLLIQSVSQSQQNLLLKQRVLESKRRHLKSQMNPHFIFNVLTGIQHLLQNAQSERAGMVFHRFRRLLMLGFMSQERILGPLSQEIHHVEQYLELEGIRVSKPIAFEWEIAPDVIPEITPCPLFILQPLVENAIWHGLSNSTVQNPRLLIRIEWVHEDLVISIYDNGVGLKKESIGMTKHQSRGTSIVRERLVLLRHRGNLEVVEKHLSHPFTQGVMSRLRLPLWALEPSWNANESRRAG